MSFSRDFSDIVVEPDKKTVRVTGTTKSIDRHGTSHLADEPDGVEIFVTLIGLPGGAGPIVAQADVGAGASWPARFAGGATTLADSTDVRMIGVALRHGDAPFVWEATRSLSHR